MKNAMVSYKGSGDDAVKAMVEWLRQNPDSDMTVVDFRSSVDQKEYQLAVARKGVALGSLSLPKSLAHVYKTCSCGGYDAEGEKRQCAICDWGASVCTVCGAAEGQLQPTCPGRKLTGAEHDAYYSRGELSK